LMLSKVRKVWKRPASPVQMENLFKGASTLQTDDQEEVDSGVVDVVVVVVGETTAGRRKDQKRKIEATRKASMTLSLKRSHADKEVVITEVVADVEEDVVAVEDTAVDQDPAVKALEMNLEQTEMTTMKGIALVKEIVVKEVDVEATQADDHVDSADVQDEDHHKAQVTKEVGTAIMTTAVINTKKMIVETEVTEMTPAVVVIAETATEIETETVTVSVVIVIIVMETVMAGDPDVADTGGTGKS